MSFQREYQDKGVVVVTISDESPEQLREYVRVKGAGINFTVAADDLPGRTARNYQQAFDQFQYPRAYIVGKDGNVLWFGHPLTEGMGRVVDDLTAGRFNLAQTQKKVIAREQLEQYLICARQNDPRGPAVGWKLLTLRTNDAAGSCELASQIATDPAIENGQRDVALAMSALDRAEQLAATNATDITVTRGILLFQSGKEAEGLAKVKQAAQQARTQDEKDEVKICVRAMEARLAAKDHQTNAPANPAKTPTAKP